jgi:hypothetical protein
MDINRIDPDPLETQEWRDALGSVRITDSDHDLPGATAVVDHWSMMPTVLGAVSGTMPEDHVDGDAH